MRLAVAAVYLAQLLGALQASAYPCSDRLLTAEAGSEAVAEQACLAAQAAKSLLVSCGLNQTYPISIKVVDVVHHPTFGDCMALYDQRTGCIQVTEIDRLAGLLPQGDGRLALPSEVLFSAAITHEMAHALLQQSAEGKQIDATEQEFVASALEMQSLDAGWRDLLLQSHPVAPPGSLGLVHLSIYALDPRAFANNAWVVFDQKAMGCSLIRKIAEGEFQFPRH